MLFHRSTKLRKKNFLSSHENINPRVNWNIDSFLDKNIEKKSSSFSSDCVALCRVFDELVYSIGVHFHFIYQLNTQSIYTLVIDFFKIFIYIESFKFQGFTLELHKSCNQKIKTILNIFTVLEFSEMFLLKYLLYFCSD